MNCKKCGAEIKKEWKACPKCGEKITKTQNDKATISGKKVMKKGFNAVKVCVQLIIGLITIGVIATMILTGKSEEELTRELRGEKSVEDAYSFNPEGSGLIDEEEVIELDDEQFSRNSFEYDGKKIKLYTGFTILADQIVVSYSNGYLGTGWSENEPIQDEQGNSVNLMMGDRGYVIGVYHADTESIEAESIVISTDSNGIEDNGVFENTEEIVSTDEETYDSNAYEYFIGATGDYMSGGTDDEYTTNINVYRRADYIELELSSSESGYLDGYSGIVTGDSTAIIDGEDFELSLEWTDEGTFVINRRGTTGNSEIDNMTDNLEYVNVDYYNAG